MLKNIEGDEEALQRAGDLEGKVILLSVNSQLPQVGTTVQASEVKLGLNVLKTALLHEPDLATQLEVIDASDSGKIKVQIKGLPIPVWLAVDSVRSGLHYISLLLKQQKNKVLEFVREGASTTQPYLDVRFEDTFYLGGYTDSN